MDQLFIRNEEDAKLVDLAKGLADAFRDQAKVYDQTREFPFDHYKILVDSGYTRLTVPKDYGGEEISLYQMMLVQETLAQGDQAVALGIGWHLSLLMELGWKREWKEEIFQKLCQAVIEERAIMNRAATEPQTGSPSRGGKPQTTARKTESGWILNGHKTFTTLAPIANPLIVNASIEGTDEVAGFMIPKGTEGLEIDPTWNTLAMRATRSDDVYLKNVALPPEAKVDTVGGGKVKLPPAHLMHIPAVYSGISLAARRDVIEFASTYQPNSLPHPIKEVPHVRDKVAQIELAVLKSRTMLYQVAETWDRFPEKRSAMGATLFATKTAVTNAAVEVTDIAMRIVGGQSLYEVHPFERYYRDVRAGLHNPPSDDVAMGMLARQAFDGK